MFSVAAIEEDNTVTGTNSNRPFGLSETAWGKLDTQLQSKLAQAVTDSDDQDAVQVILRLAPDAGRDAPVFRRAETKAREDYFRRRTQSLVNTLENLGGTGVRELWLVDSIAVELSPGAIATIANDTSVVMITHSTERQAILKTQLDHDPKEHKMSELSQDHVDRFERAERREIEKLRAEFGSESISKMDSIVLRDLLANRKEAHLNAFLGHTETAQLPRHRVLVLLRSGRTSPDRAPRAFDRRQRRRLIMQHRRHGEDVVGQIAKSFGEREIEVEQTFWLNHSLVVWADDQRLTDIAGRADVLKVAHCKNQILIDLDNSRPLINADAVEASGITGAEVDVAVLDTGVDQTHPELAANFGTQQDFTGEGLGDLNGHGTHCAGVVASNGATFRGVATGAVIHDYKLLNQFGSGNAPNCVSAIQQAVADGMDVLSNSWASPIETGIGSIQTEHAFYVSPRTRLRQPA